MVICKKCGANIPDNAAFCPGCGAAKPEGKPSPELQPVAPAPAIKTPKSSGSGLQGLANTLFSKMFLMLGISIGLLLAWIGKILTVFTSGTVSQVGNVLVFTGLVGMGFVLLGGGLLNKNLDKYIRLGMIVGSSILITFALAMTFSFSMPDYSSMLSGFY